jgi:hypothetical protein
MAVCAYTGTARIEHVNIRLRALTGAKTAQTANDRDSDIDFISKSKSIKRQ